MTPLLASVQRLLQQMESDADAAARQTLADAQRRLDEPLRVAFAGRVKAGKSTLLNAVIGADIAASDAAECTRYVTWYRYGDQLAAFVVDTAGQRRAVRFLSDNAIDLSGEQADSIQRLEVEYPSPVLRTTTLIDTPGIASISEDVSARSSEFLVPESSDQGADVLIYLLRFLHERDANFLEAFTDPSAHRNDPLRSLAVLSRADELGAGRGDGFAIARRAAERYRQSSALRGQVSDVMPVSGLLGLHAESLSNEDLEALRTVAALPLHGQERVLLSAERFSGQVLPGLSSHQRSSLLVRFGIQGVRYAVAMIRLEPSMDVDGLRRCLLQVSGVVPLRSIVANRYANRSEVLKASRALDVAHGLIQRGVGGKTVHREYERIEANAHEILEISALRKIAQARSSDRLPGSIAPDLVASLEAAMGAEGIRLHERLQCSDDGRDLVDEASQRIDRLRSALNTPAIPREWQRHIRFATRSLEVAVHQFANGS